MGYVAGDFVAALAVSPSDGVGWSSSLLPVDQTLAAKAGFEETATARMVTPQQAWAGTTPTPEAQEACEGAAGIPLDIPAVDPKLDDALYALTMQVVENTPAASPDLFATCMKGSGYTVTDRDQFINGLMDQRSGLVPSATESNAAVADTACRTTTHAAVTVNLDAPLTAFARQNQDELAALASRPDELQAQAMTAAQEIGLQVDWL